MPSCAAGPLDRCDASRSVKIRFDRSPVTGDMKEARRRPRDEKRPRFSAGAGDDLEEAVIWGFVPFMLAGGSITRESSDFQRERRVSDVASLFFLYVRQQREY